MLGKSDDPRTWPPIITAIGALQAIADLPAGANADIERGREDAYRAIERLFPNPPEIEVATPSTEAPRAGVVRIEALLSGLADQQAIPDEWWKAEWVSIRAELAASVAVAAWYWVPPHKHYRIEHDGFAGTVIGCYTTLEGKRGAVLQLDNGRIVHVYGEKWLRDEPDPARIDGDVK